MKNIGGVKLDYTFYNSKYTYSDGDIENILLDAAEKENVDYLLKSSNKYPVLYHFSPIRENILEWYDFKPDATLLEIGSGCGALTGLFARKVSKVTCVELSERRSLINANRNKNYSNVEIKVGRFQDIQFTEKYDYITLIGVLEYAVFYTDKKNPYINFLAEIKKLLKPNGKLFIAIENKMGLKYWNGALEDHTSVQFDGINDYCNSRGARTFSRPELENILSEAGFSNYKFYYPEPDYKLPEVIFSDDRLPNPGEIRNYRKDYCSPRQYLFNAAIIEDQICRDRKYDYFANSFLIECGNDISNVVYVKYSDKRKKEYRIITQIEKENNEYVVKKRGAHVESYEKQNCILCKNHSLDTIRMVQGKLKDGQLTYDYISGETLENVIYKNRDDIEEICKVINDFFDAYGKAVEDTLIDFVMTDSYKDWFGDEYIADSKSLTVTNIDMLASNIIINDGKYYVIDDEWVFDFPIPTKYVLFRCAYQIYSTYKPYFMDKICDDDFLIKFGFNQNDIGIYRKMEKKFAERVMGEDYRINYRKPALSLHNKIII